MIRNAVFAVMVLAVAPPAQALPPPTPVTIVVLSPERAAPGRIEASERLVGVLAAEHWFDGLAVEGFGPALFAACNEDGGSGDGTQVCIRETLTRRGAEVGLRSLVAVLVAPGPGSTVTWTCVGENADKAQSKQRTSPFDPDLASGPAKQETIYRAAVGCIIAAAAEQGW